MTKEEIIEMAEKAGYIYLPLVTRNMELKELRTFAKLVAEKEREKCAKLCEEYFERVMASRIRAMEQE